MLQVSTNDSLETYMSPLFFLLFSGSVMAGFAVLTDQNDSASLPPPAVKPSISSGPSIPNSDLSSQKVPEVITPQIKKNTGDVVMTKPIISSPVKTQTREETQDINKLESWMK